jgi:hypothetical protein
MTNPEQPTTSPYTTLRTLANLYDNSQKTRIGLGNQLAAMERGDTPNLPEHRRLLELWQARYGELESALLGEIGSLLKDHPLFPYVDKIKGMGPSLTGKLLAPIDIHRADTVSALWKYCGQGVNDQGERDRPRKGEKLAYNARLKSVCYLISTSFLKTRSPYRVVYDDAKAQYERTKVTGNKETDWTPAHVHMASMRKMVKVFLAHLWVTWRTVEGLPTRALYVHEYLGHTSEYAAEDFGWPTVEQIRADLAAPAPVKKSRGRKVA